MLQLCAGLPRLTASECTLPRALLVRHGAAAPYRTRVARAWGDPAGQATDDARLLKGHIRNPRRKPAAGREYADCIRTVAGASYSFPCSLEVAPSGAASTEPALVLASD